MAETFEDYQRRILGYVKGRDARRILRRTPGALERRISGVPRRRLSTPPGPGRWSVTHILAHLSEIELLWAYRIRTILDWDGAAIVGMDQDAWARNSRYDRIDPRRALDTFRGIRQSNLDLLDALSPRQRRRRGVHSQFGTITISDIFALMAGHDVNHSRQIQSILAKRRRS